MDQIIESLLYTKHQNIIRQILTSGKLKKKDIEQFIEVMNDCRGCLFISRKIVDDELSNNKINLNLNLNMSVDDKKPVKTIKNDSQSVVKIFSDYTCKETNDNLRKKNKIRNRIREIIISQYFTFKHPEYFCNNYFSTITIQENIVSVKNFMKKYKKNLYEYYYSNRHDYYSYDEIFYSKIAKILHTIHQLGLVYNDLKPENILVYINKEESADIVFCDFEFVSFIEEEISVCGTAGYINPDNFLNNTTISKVSDDYYSFAIMYLELLYHIDIGNSCIQRKNFIYRLRKLGYLLESKYKRSKNKSFFHMKTHEIAISIINNFLNKKTIGTVPIPWNPMIEILETSNWEINKK